MNQRQLFLKSLIKCVHRDAPIHLVIGLYCVLMFVGMLTIGPWGPDAFFVYVDRSLYTFLLFMPCVLLACELSYVVFRYDRRRRLAYRRIFSPERVARLMAGMFLLISTSLFFGAFTWLKNMLPVLQGGFSHDRWQADLDLWLHAGTDPWLILWSLPFAAKALPAISYSYSVIWYAVCFGALFFVATSPKADGIRYRYLTSYLFVWIVIGNALPAAGLSAGPAFYGSVTNDTERFASLVAALAGDHSEISAGKFQAYLWMLYEGGLSGFGSGISAFPSVHVGLIVMNALFLWDYSRWLGLIAFGYSLLIMASSVYLGWHYALDGYVSAVVTLLAHLAFKFRPGRNGFISCCPVRKPLPDNSLPSC